MEYGNLINMLIEEFTIDDAIQAEKEAGYENGRKDECINIALKMIANGRTISEIVKNTGLILESVEYLYNYNKPKKNKYKIYDEYFKNVKLDILYDYTADNAMKAEYMANYEEAMEEERKRIAQNMKSNGFSLKEIMEDTGLSELY